MHQKRSTWKLQNLCYFLQRHLYFSPEGNSYGTRVITRLDITMQLLIQDIFSQIIDSSPQLPERLRDFSCRKFPFKTKLKVLSHVNSFWSEIYKKCQKWSECLKLIWSGTFAICSTQPLWLWSRIGSRVKIIQPSNLSSALRKIRRRINDLRENVLY